LELIILNDNFAVLIVDDESIVRKGLKILIDWEHLGISKLYDAADGPSAYRMAYEVKPDIVITDIRMPEMNGINLIRNIKTILPESVCIIISGYNDFESAREGIEVGAFDFLIKPIDPNELSEIIIKAKDHIIKKHGLQDKLNIMEKGMDQLKKIEVQQFFLDIINGDIFETENQINRKLSLENVHFKYNHYICIILKFITNNDVCKEQLSCICTIIESELGYCYTFNNSEQLNMFFFPNKDGCTIICGYDCEGDIKNVIISLENIIKDLKTAFNVEVVFVIGSPVDRLVDFNVTFLESKRIAEYKLFVRKPGNFKTKIGTNYQSKNLDIHIFESLNREKLLDSIYTNNTESIENELIKLVENIRNVGYKSKGYVLGIILEIMIYVNREMLKKGLPCDEITNAYSYSYEFLNGFSTIDQVCDWLNEHFSIIALAYSTMMKLDNERILINNIKKYLINNIDKNILLEELSDVFHYNSSYLSRIFKKVENINFSTFVNNQRIKTAKSLLQNTEETIDIIAQKVGFCDSSYFVKVFKGQTGLTPSKYRVLSKG
jgi:two-component system response regulator YesN